LKHKREEDQEKSPNPMPENTLIRGRDMENLQVWPGENATTTIEEECVDEWHGYKNSG
jgi:hypothetical protein